MKDKFELIIKGIIIGIGKIIPGVSGSLLAMMLGVYEKSINAISNIFKSFYKNFLFLGCLAIGILISIVLGARTITVLLDIDYFLTMAIFIGLIVGTSSDFVNKIIKNNKINYFYTFLAFLLILILESIKINNKIVINNNLDGYILALAIGFIDSITMIVPGISGTAIFILIGCYEFVLNIYANIFSIFTLFFMIGLIIGVFFISKLINYLFKVAKDKLYSIIYGLIIASIYFLLKDLFAHYKFFYEIPIGLLLFGVGFHISKSIKV